MRKNQPGCACCTPTPPPPCGEPCGICDNKPITAVSITDDYGTHPLVLHSFNGTVVWVNPTNLIATGSSLDVYYVPAGNCNPVGDFVCTPGDTYPYNYDVSCTSGTITVTISAFTAQCPDCSAYGYWPGTNLNHCRTIIAQAVSGPAIDCTSTSASFSFSVRNPFAGPVCAGLTLPPPTSTVTVNFTLSASAPPCCFPCAIPTTSLYFHWSNTQCGDGSAAMSYSAGHWTVSNAGCTGGTSFLLDADFSCSDGDWLLTVYKHSDHTNFCSYPGSIPQSLSLTSYTCSPFFGRWSVAMGACPTLNVAGYTSFTISTTP
jgi:hypothetical protein